VTSPTILIVNPNANARTTAMLARIARQHLASTSALRHYSVTGIDASGVAGAPQVIVDPQQLAASVPHVIAGTLAALTPDTVAVIVGAIGDPGIAELRKALTIPVVGIGGAAMRAAARNGRRFGIVTTTPLLVSSLAALAHNNSGASTAAGTQCETASFAGIQCTVSSVEQLAETPDMLLPELAEAIHILRTGSPLEAVVIGGGPLSDSARQLAAVIDIPVIEPLPSALDEILTLLATPGEPTAVNASYRL
jgi:allantoin racemase